MEIVKSIIANNAYFRRNIVSVYNYSDFKLHKFTY